MLYLIIKGNREAAETAAKARGIEIKYLRENSRETFADASPEQHTAVQNWFCEAPRQAPYPVGSLLFYQDLGA